MTATHSPQLASANIPKSLTPFFQEYDLANLNLQRASATIIERVLQYGNRAEIRWLFQVYPKSEIAGWVSKWGDYALPEPHLTFWKLVLDLSEET
jgi:hypothetical protein